MQERLKILFLCTGNSCRSQMAEGWAKHLKADDIAAWSAGIEKHGLNLMAVETMAEVGVDIGNYASKTIDELPVQDFNYVITLCGHASETCPLFSGGAKKIHAGFDDPPALAKDESDEDAARGHYRRVRDEIRAFVESLPDSLKNHT